MPKTKYGKWSVGLILGFVLFLAIFFIVVKMDYRGGDTFFSNPLLAIPILISGICGVMSMITGVLALFKEKERSVFVYISILLGLFVSIFVLGEIITPH